MCRCRASTAGVTCRTPAGWKICDITAEGVNLVLSYRSEFDQAVREAGIDGLMRRIAEKR